MWHCLDEARSDWSTGKDGSILLVLVKRSDCVASWPHMFQSVAIRGGADSGAGRLQPVWQEDKAAFETRADDLLDQRQLVLSEVRAAFLHAVREQTMRGAQTLLGQTVLSFPSEGAKCLRFLETSSHLPAVAKIIRIVQRVRHSTLRCLGAFAARRLAHFTQSVLQL